MDHAAHKLGRLLGRIAGKTWTRAQRKHVANLVARVNRKSNRARPAGLEPLIVMHTTRGSRGYILRKSNIGA